MVKVLDCVINAGLLGFYDLVFDVYADMFNIFCLDRSL